MNRFVYWLLPFFVLLAIGNVEFNGLNISRFFLFTVFIFGFFKSYVTKKNSISKGSLVYVYGYMPILLVVTLIFSFASVFDYSFIKIIYLNLFYSVMGVVIFVSLLNGQYSRIEVISFLYWAIFLHATMTLLYFINSDVREFVNMNFPASRLLAVQGNILRPAGVVSLSGASLSVLHSLGLFVGTYLLLNESGLYKKIIIFLSLCFVFLSVFLIGRSGLVSILFIFIFCLFKMLCSPRKWINLKFMRSSVISIFIVSLVIFLFYFFVISNMELPKNRYGEDIFLRSIRWVSEELVSLIFSSEKVNVLDVLKDHVIYKLEGWQLFFGNGDSWTYNRIESDIGYVRIFHAIGVLGFVVFYSTFVFYFIFSFLSLKKADDKMFLLLLFACFFVLEAKEPFLIKTPIMACLMYFLCAFNKVKLKNN